MAIEPPDRLTTPRVHTPTPPTTESHEIPASAAAHHPAGRAPVGELTSALSAFVLLVVTFAMKWYGIVALPHSADRAGIQGATSGWTQLTLGRWLILASVLVAIGSVALHLSQRTHGSQTDTSLIVTVIGTVTALELGYRVLVNMPAPHSVIDAKLGAYLGVVAATGVALGGYESVLAVRRLRRAKRGGQRRPQARRSRPADSPGSV
jgi:hypothetical protein